MHKSDEMKRFEADLAASEELCARLEEECRQLAKTGNYDNDTEVSVAAASALGYNISAADFERTRAAMETLDDEILEQVAGGEDLGDPGDVIEDAFSCGKDYMCSLVYHQRDFEDEYGHNGFCVAVWHCSSALLHTQSNSKDRFCWENYGCYMSVEG
ncbi:MAG: hypothetical protein IKG21_01545 [Atopobiaceae bacterium]|nr:hypothetical protein [Atopobiaceae bacterium]